MRYQPEEFRPSLRLSPLGAVRCFGGGGGGSADQTQTQQQTTITTQQGVGDESLGVFGNSNSLSFTSVSQSLDPAAIEAALTGAAEIADSANKAAVRLGVSSNETAASLAKTGAATAQNLGLGAFDLAESTAGKALNLAGQTSQGAYDLALGVNRQNTSLLDSLAALFGGGMADANRLNAQLASGAMSGAFDLSNALTRGGFTLAGTLAGGSNDLAAKLAGAAIQEAADSRQQFIAESSMVTQQSQKLTDNTLERITDLAKTTATGGQSDTNATFKWIGLAMAGALAVAFFSRK